MNSAERECMTNKCLCVTFIGKLYHIYTVYSEKYYTHHIIFVYPTKWMFYRPKKYAKMSIKNM